MFAADAAYACQFVSQVVALDHPGRKLITGTLVEVTSSEACEVSGRLEDRCDSATSIRDDSDEEWLQERRLRVQVSQSSGHEGLCAQPGGCHDADVAGQIRLFDDMERDSRSPAKRAESQFAFLNRTGRPYFAPVRDLLEDWFSHLPPDVQPALRSRFRKDDPGQNMGAFWELYLHEAHRRLGFAIQYEPPVPGHGPKPRFPVRARGGTVLPRGWSRIPTRRERQGDIALRGNAGLHGDVDNFAHRTIGALKKAVDRHEPLRIAGYRIYRQRWHEANVRVRLVPKVRLEALAASMDLAREAARHERSERARR